MSMITCANCGMIIDSDDDPDCFVTIDSGVDWCLCDMCRELRDMAADSAQDTL